MGTQRTAPARLGPAIAIGLSIVAIVLVLVDRAPVAARAMADQPSAAEPRRLVVLWTTGDREVAERMALMYTNAAKKNGWWDEVTLVVWGPSAKLLSVDIELQQQIKSLQANGVKIEACIVCANMYSVTDKLRDLGISVRGMGKPLTEMLQSGWTLLSV